MNDKYYVNEATGDITKSHREAVEWYRSGVSVSIWTKAPRTDDYVLRLIWTH